MWQIDEVADAWLQRAEEIPSSTAQEAVGPAGLVPRRGITRERFAELLDPDELAALMTFPI